MAFGPPTHLVTDDPGMRWPTGIRRYRSTGPRAPSLWPYQCSTRSTVSRSGSSSGTAVASCAAIESPRSRIARAASTQMYQGLPSVGARVRPTDAIVPACWAPKIVIRKAMRATASSTPISTSFYFDNTKPMVAAEVAPTNPIPTSVSTPTQRRRARTLTSPSAPPETRLDRCVARLRMAVPRATAVTGRGFAATTTASATGAVPIKMPTIGRSRMRSTNLSCPVARTPSSMARRPRRGDRHPRPVVDAGRPTCRGAFAQGHGAPARAASPSAISAASSAVVGGSTCDPWRTHTSSPRNLAAVAAVSR